MKKRSVLSQHEQGSAEQVVAHAAWQRSRGRNPSMSFIGEHNPRKALALAHYVILVVRLSKGADLIATVLGWGGRRRYRDMTDAEIKIVAEHIITSSSSEAEVKQRLRDELDYPYGVVLDIYTTNDATGREARELVRGLGGLVMKNGAMAMAVIQGHNGDILL